MGAAKSLLVNKSKQDVSSKTTGSGATNDSINKSQQSSGGDKTKDKSNMSGSQTSKEKETSQGTSGGITQIFSGKPGQELDPVKSQDTIDSGSKENDNKNHQKESAKVDWNDLLDSEEDTGSKENVSTLE